MNNSFCSLAWLGVTVDPDGTLRPCCVSTDKILKDDGTEFNLGADKLQDIYNSNYYRTLRKQMRDGEYIKGCETCYNNEKYGRESRRLINNESYKDFNYDSEDLSIQYMDLRLGNLCNLKCRMCSPLNSSLVEDEYVNNPSSIYDQYSFISKHNLQNWYNTDIFDENINAHFQNVTTLYLTGGEPTLIKKNYDILQRLIDLGQHKKMSLIINTNMTNSNPKFYELIKDFKSVIIQMSVDAIDDLNYYIRYPTDWNQVDKTLKDLINLEGNISLRATPVIQILNLNGIVDLFNYFENFNKLANRLIIDIRPGFVHNPHHLNMQYLPKEYKIECYRKIHKWMFDSCQYQSNTFKDFIQALKKKCYEDSFDLTLLKSFMEYNSHLDKLRSVSLKDYNPTLYKLLEKYV